MGYTPNAVAQSLKGQRTNTIGLIVTSIADPFYGRLVRGVDEVARQSDVDVFLGVSYDSAEEEMAVIESFRRRRVEGGHLPQGGYGTRQLLAGRPLVAVYGGVGGLGKSAQPGQAVLPSMAFSPHIPASGYIVASPGSTVRS